jgi:phosphoserine phosphatase
MRWPPYKHIFFDCDSTLTTVEGIDILAETADKKWRIEILTNAAMNGHLDLGDVYGKRLKAIKPTRKQVQAIKQVYKRNLVEDAAAVIQTLQQWGHHVYIISGGLAEPVAEFGVWLGVPRERIRAVGLNYNALCGQWWQSQNLGEERYLQFEEGALTISDGKAEIVRELLGEQDGRSLLIGDGSSDLLASRAVDLFVGYGGVIERQNVLATAPAYLHSASLAPLLTLAAGPFALKQLGQTTNKHLVAKIQQLIAKGAITFNDERLSKKFHEAYQAIHSRAD